jgi:hypothetical protein
MSKLGFKVWSYGGITTINSPASTGCNLFQMGSLFTYTELDISVSDTINITIDDVQSVLASIVTIESIALSISDTASIIVSLSITDSLGLNIGEAYQISASISAVDNIDSLSDDASILANAIVSDLIEILIDSDLSLSARFPLIDSINISINDTTIPIGVTLVTSDNIDSLIESKSIYATLVSSDSCSVSIDDIITLVNRSLLTKLIFIIESKNNTFTAEPRNRVFVVESR